MWGGGQTQAPGPELQEGQTEGTEAAQAGPGGALSPTPDRARLEAGGQATQGPAGGGAHVSGGRRGCRRVRGSSQGPVGMGSLTGGPALPRGVGVTRAPGRGRRLGLWVPSSAARDEADHRTGPRGNIHMVSGICLTQGRGRKSARGGHHALRGCLGRFHGREFKTVLGICCPHQGPSSNFLGHLAIFTE